MSDAADPTGSSAKTTRRTIFITGANGGLGIAVARSFLGESRDNFVFLGFHLHNDKISLLAEEFPQHCRRLKLDVTRPQDWARAVSEVLAVTNRLDVLVNNAGIIADGLLATMPPAQWKSVLATNLEGAFHGCQAVLPQMISQRHGRIINIASLSALLAPPGQTNYAAAKAGLVALTQSLAKEVARLNITVNAVCPGFVETDALRALGEAECSNAKARIPMRRFGKPEEVAVAVRFLACPEASYITGSVLKVDGGVF